MSLISEQVLHPLVTTAWLADHLDQSNLLIIDIRGHVMPANQPLPHYFNHHADYMKAHIPGALFVDWVYAITDPDDPRHAPVAKKERYQALMRGLGLNADTFVIAYDDATGMFAARLWWTLHYYGHSNVAVLDGGWPKWVVEGRSVTDIVPNIVPGNFVAHADHIWRRTADQVLSAINSPTRLVDVRSPDEFAGKMSRAIRNGHIPNAVNVPRTNLINADGTMLPPEKLREIFASQGIDDLESEVITYCNAGVSASYGLLALQIAGFRHGSVYDGSWKDWGNDPSKPITN